MATRFVKNPNSNLSGFYPNGWSDASPNAGSNQVYWCNRAPTVNDFHNWFIGARWIDQSPAGNPEIYTLVKKENKVATWVRNFTGASALESLTGEAGTNPVLPTVADTINVSGYDNTNSVGDAANNTIYVNLNNTIHWPDTNAAGTEGVIYLGAAGTPLAGGVLFLHNYGTDNTFLGSSSGNLVLDGTVIENVAIGSNALATVTTNTSGCVAIGYNALLSADNTAIGHVAVGAYAGENLTGPMAQPSGHVAIGYKALQNCTATAYASQAIGSLALNSATTGTQNTAIGTDVMRDLVDGIANVAAGNGSLSSVTVGSSRNTVIGHGSAPDVTSAIYTTICGKGALRASTGSSSYNTLLGAYTGDLIVGDTSYNILIGYKAGTDYTTTESSNIIIGNPGTVADANTIRIGTDGAGAGQQDATYIAGIRDAAVAADAVPVLIDSTHKVGTTGGLTGTSGFFARLSATTGGVTGNGTTYTIICDSELYDVGGVYNNATGTFTSPADGYYMLSGIAEIGGIVAATQGNVSILANGVEYYGGTNSPVAVQNVSGLTHYNITIIAYMPAASTAIFRTRTNGEGADINTVYGEAVKCFTYFFGRRLY